MGKTMCNLDKEINEKYFAFYSKKIEIPENYWTSSHNVEYEVVES
tara:strand:+ start:301 stop:435 length:135 start_codon:yes stop_codon:yes gene_type:complete